jgi:single-strand DNA-binding protein
MINTVVLEGYLFRGFNESDIIKTNSGKEMLSFSFILANNNEKKVFVNCLAFDKTANYIFKYGAKGSKIFVNGSITSKEKDGKQYSLAVLVNSVSLVAKHNDNEGEDTQYGTQNVNQLADNETQAIIDENDLPF